MSTVAPPPPPPRSAADAPAAIPASQLFQGQSTLVIEHRGEFYQLRITRNGKLILTK
jgi:hemin uptake protein HemP